MRKMFIIVLVLILAGFGSSSVYWNADEQSSSVDSNSASITVENYFIDNGGSNSGDMSSVVKLLHCDGGGCTRYTVQSCGGADNYITEDGHPNQAEPDNPSSDNGDSYPGSPDTRTFSKSGLSVSDGDDFYLNGNLYWGSDCSGSPDEAWSINFAQNVDLNTAPNANFNVNDSQIITGQKVNFSWSSSDSDGSVQSVSLDFGDGTSTLTGLSQNGWEVHEYTGSGTTYTATLDVSDGSDTTTKTGDVSVSETCQYSASTGETIEMGDSATLTLPHNDAPNCADVSNVKFNVCGKNLTSGLMEQSTGTSPYTKEYVITFRVPDDVSCSYGSHPITWYNSSGDVLSSLADLTIQRGSTRGAPIHANGKYKPQAEIIVATEMSHPRTDYYDLQNENVANKTDTKFFICRGNYRGTNISSSKLVKVQQGSSGSYSWQYYRCAMNGTWMEASCEPGQELRQVQTGSGYACRTVAPQTITATYFNIQSIPHSGKSNGYIAGFKIPESEIQTYKDVMGFEPQKVDAECWMGDDNQRPSDSSNSVVFTSTYDGTGDLWALAEIPPRSGVNKNTYSCVWGIKNVGSTADTNVYESTNNIPLKAKDGGRTDIQYDIIETRKTSADIDTGTPRGIWSKYEAPADGGYDQRTYIQGTNHLALNGEYPYCSGNTFLDTSLVIDKGSLLQNIICSGSGGYSGYPDTFNSP